MSVSAELQRPEVRLAAIAQAKAKREARAAARFAEEQACNKGLYTALNPYPRG